MYIVFIRVIFPAVFYQAWQNDVFIAFFSYHLSAAEESLFVDAAVYHFRECFIVHFQAEFLHPHIACGSHAHRSVSIRRFLHHMLYRIAIKEIYLFHYHVLRAHFQQVSCRFAFSVSVEIMESRYRIRCVFRYSCKLECFRVDPCFMCAAAEDHHRPVCADRVQHFLFRAGLVKDPFSITDAEISLVVRIRLHVFFDLSQTFFYAPFDLQIHSAEIMRRQYRVAVTVYEARQHHLSCQIRDFRVFTA